MMIPPLTLRIALASRVLQSQRCAYQTVNFLEVLFFFPEDGAGPSCTIENWTPISWPWRWWFLVRIDVGIPRHTPCFRRFQNFKSSRSAVTARYEPWRKQQHPLRRLRHLRMPGWRWWPWSPLVRWSMLNRVEDHLKRDIWCYSQTLAYNTKYVETV